MGIYDGKVVFITGGARGQGRAHAVTSAREGASVAIFDIDAPLPTVNYDLASEDDATETVRLVEELGRPILSFTGDVRDSAALEAAVAKTIEEFGRIDVVIANAGIWAGSMFWDITDEQWQETIDINLTGVWRTVKAVTPQMMKQQSGSVIITSSMNGIEPEKGYSNYIAAKTGAIGLGRAMALELAEHGIRVNIICPGSVASPITDRQGGYDMAAGRENATREEWIDAGYNYFALKETTFLSPQTMADAALFLSSPGASAITGLVMPVDGGHGLMPGFNHAPVKPEVIALQQQ